MTTTKPVPPPLVNVIAPLTGEHKTIFEAMLGDVIALFGIAESSKHHAAARLAGILVVAASLDELPHSIVFRKTMDLPQQSWESGAIWNATYLNVPINQDTTTEYLVKAALHLQGGVAGEYHCQLDHPASLLEDLYINTVCMGYLGLDQEMDVNSLAARFAFKASEILQDNKQIYSAIFESFGLRAGMSIAEVRTLLSAVPLTELNTLLMRCQ